MNDLVIDTNVYLHAANPGEPRMADSKKLLELFWDRDLSICVDDGFSTESARNKSQIGHEYIERIVHGTLGCALIEYLAQNQRITMVNKKVDDRAGKAINRSVRSKRDRVFVKVAYNSRNKMLVSHDFADIPAPNRVALRRSIEVRVDDAAAILQVITEDTEAE